MKKWLKSPWGISIGTATFTVLISFFLDWVIKKPVFSTIWIIIKAVWSAVITFLNLELKVWWIILIITGLVLIILTVIRIIRINYTKDTFQHWKWSWKWKYNKHRKLWEIINLVPHCPNCDTPLIDYSGGYWGTLRFSCPRCNFTAEGSNCDVPNKVELIILDNVKRKIKKHDKRNFK